MDVIEEQKMSPPKLLGRLSSFEASIILRFLPAKTKLTTIALLNRSWN